VISRAIFGAWPVKVNGVIENTDRDDIVFASEPGLRKLGRCNVPKHRY
jgi:hypothetical protein